MDANELANIWRRPIYLPYLQDPLTPEALRAAEKELGHALPRELAMMLSVQNGGYLRYKLESYRWTPSAASARRIRRLRALAGVRSANA